MVDGDIFREIEEELKREQFAKLWDRFGYLIVGAALAIVAAVGGYKYWKHEQAAEAQDYGVRYMSALDLARGEKKDMARVALAQIANDGPRGYAMLAKMRDAAVKASSGKPADAVDDYDKLAGNGDVDPVFQDFSRIQAAMLRVDEADEAEMQKRLGTLAKSNSSWRHSARELLGLAAYKAGNLKQAETYYNQVVADRTAPRGVRQRADMMLSLITAETSEKVMETKTEDKKAEDKKGKAGKTAKKPSVSFKIPSSGSR